MAIPKLSNYLRTYRKRIGLSQDEVAFLLGWKNAAHLSRYENFTRTPALRSALALEIILQTATKDLFAGEYQNVEAAICRRAKLLANRLRVGGFCPAASRKLEVLQVIVLATNTD